MNTFLQLVNWGDAVTDIISNLIVTFITALVGVVFVKRYLFQLNFSNRMQKLGFVNTSTNKQSQLEIKHMCDTAEEIKIINVSGFHYLNDNEINLKRALERGVKIKFLCSHPKSFFLNDIENMEYHQIDGTGKRMREKNKKISTEIFDLINKYHKFGMEIRFYSSEYRLPYVLAYYGNGNIKAWLTMTLPPYKSTKSFVLRGEKKKELIYDNETNFIDMMETNFDIIWEHGSKSISEIMEKKDE